MGEPDRRVPSRAQVYAASATQSRLILMRYAPGGMAARIVGVHLLVRGPLDVGRLRIALVELTRRHDILRTNYALSGSGELFAILHQDEGPDVLEVTEPTGLLDERLIGAHGNTLLDGLVDRFAAPDRHSMLQAVVVPHTAELHSLVLAIDHVAVDERSKALLQRELAALYAGRHDELGEPVPYDPAAVRSVFPAVDEVPGLRELLMPLPLRFLPSPDADRDPEAFRPVVVESALGPSVAEQVAAAARRLRCTRYVVHVAAVAWALKQFSGSDDISMATPMDTRLRPQDFETVGLFQNLVLLRSRSRRTAGIGATFEECRAGVRDAFGRRDYPVAALVEVARAGRGGVPCRNPLYQVGMVYATEDVDLGWSLDGAEVAPVELEHTEASIELMVQLTESPSGTKVLLLGAAGALDSADLDRLLVLWRAALEELTGDDADVVAGAAQRFGSSAR